MANHHAPHIVGLGGTTRDGSSTEKALRYALAVCQRAGAAITCLSGRDLSCLPLYSPQHPERTLEARQLVDALRRADGIIIASASYHGSLSGLVKNALDYAEDLRDDPRPYFSGRPVGCIATGAGWQGVVSTLEHLRSIVHALRGWVTPLGVAINTSGEVFGPRGEVLDQKTAFQLTTLAEEVMAFTRWRAAAG